MNVTKQHRNFVNGVFTMVVLSLFIAGYARADNNVNACELSGQCITPGQYGFGFAIGYGERKSALVDVEDVEYWILPELYYYGHHVFFDNGTLGWRFKANSRIEWSVVSRINPERSYFDEHYLGTWLESPFTSENSDTISLPLSQTSPGYNSESSSISVRSVSKRKHSIDVGIQFDSSLSHWLVRGQLYGDALGRHGGFTGNIMLERKYYSNTGIFSLRGTITYKSDALIDYYYGITMAESQLHQYDGESVWQPTIALSWQKPLSEHWRLLATYQYTLLGSGIEKSPLAKTDSVSTWFIGVGYRF